VPAQDSIAEWRERVVRVVRVARQHGVLPDLDGFVLVNRMQLGLRRVFALAAPAAFGLHDELELAQAAHPCAWRGSYWHRGLVYLSGQLLSQAANKPLVCRYSAKKAS